MSSPKVLQKTASNSSDEYESDAYETDLESDRVPSVLPSMKTYDEESSIAKLPGSSLLRSVHNKKNFAQLQGRSNHDSVKSLQSDHTYDFDKKHSSSKTDLYDGVDEFGAEDQDGLPPPPPKTAAIPKLPPSSSPSAGARVPAWKLRQQALRSDAPRPTIIDSANKNTNTNTNGNKHRSPTRTLRKTSSANNNHRNNNRSPKRTLRKTNSTNSEKSNGSGSGSGDEASWFKKLTTKKETPEEKEKRLKSERIIQKQNSSRWGKDILEEEESSEEADEEADMAVLGTEERKSEKKSKWKSKTEPKDDEEPKRDEDEDESDTVKKVKSLIEKSFGSALVATIKKDKNAPGKGAFAFSKSKANGTEPSSNDEDDSTTTDPSSSSPPKASRGNRWAMMGSAAMTSVRNMQKGWKENDEDAKNTEPIAEGEEDKDESGKEEDEEDGDVVAEIQPDTTNRRGFMWRNKGAAAFTSVRNKWGSGKDNGDEASSHADDGLDSKSVHSEPDRLDREASDNPKKDNKILSSIANFWEHTRAKFDPEVWADPEIQESLASIEKLKKKLHGRRTEHKSVTRRRERQIHNSILQQQTYLARKLHKKMYQSAKDPFHPCIKEVYEKDILIIVHEATSLFGDPDAEHEKDDIDELFDAHGASFSERSNMSEVSLGGFFGKEKEGEKKRADETSVAASEVSEFKPVNRDSLIPLETRLLRAQHNEWITDHQMELARGFQQKSVEHLYDILPELRKEHEKLKAIPQSSVDAKLRELEESNDALRKSYQAHVEAQEKLLAIYRERYVPSVHEDEDKEKETEKSEGDEDVFDSTLKSPEESPTKSPRKRPGMWTKGLSQSMRGIFGPKRDEGSNKEKKDDDNDSVGSGFELASPITGGSQTKKFILSFGSIAGSGAASGILANFAPPSLDIDPPLATKSDSQDTDDTANRQEQQESAKDSAAAAWTVPGMDKASLPETLAEKRAKRAAARRANRPDALESRKSKDKGTATATATATESVTATTTTTAVSSRSELLRRAREARKQTAAAMEAAPKLTSPESPTPSGRSGRISLRSSASKSTTNTSNRKELSMKDLLAAAGDSRRKLMENDSRMERLQKDSPLNSPSGAASASGSASLLSEKRRLRIVRELKQDDPLNGSGSLHERKTRTRSTRS